MAITGAGAIGSPHRALLSRTHNVTLIGRAATAQKIRTDGLRIRGQETFTAKVDARPHDPDQPTRQQAYLDALSTLPRVEVHGAELIGPMLPADGRPAWFLIRRSLANPELSRFAEYEHIAFTYQKVIWTWKDGGITAEDDWEAPVV